MRTALLLGLLLLPVASARPDVPDVDRGEARAGGCVVRWSWYWPGENLGAGCSHGGQAVFAFSHGSCALGSYTHAYAAGLSASFPCEGALDLLS